MPTMSQGQRIASCFLPAMRLQLNRSSTKFDSVALLIAGMDPGARHFLWGILQRQVIAAGGRHVHGTLSHVASLERCMAALDHGAAVKCWLLLAVVETSATSHIG